MARDFASRLTYPSPFKPSGIEFDLPDNAAVTLKIFDNSGREVATVIENRQYEAGTHYIELNSVNLAHGVYFYRLSVQDRDKRLVDTKQIEFVE